MFECPICKNSYKKIDKQHLKKHGLTIESYKKQYPYGPIGACPETKAALGSVVKNRGCRSEETKLKISQGLKGKSIGRVVGTYVTSEETKLKQSVSRKKFYKEVGVSNEWKNNLSHSLKSYYLENPKAKLDKTSDAYAKRINVLQKATVANKQKAYDRVKDEIFKIDWATFKTLNNKGDRIIVECNTCHSEIDRQLQTYRKHNFSKELCHTCFPPLNGTSKAEEDINEFLQHHEIYPQRHIRGLLSKNQELDFYIPELKIGIEYNGLYWHSSAMDYPKYKHRKKYEECLDKGIRLIQIFEDEWIKKPEIVKSKLLAILGKSSGSVYARKCSAKIITSKEASTFLDENHIQGGTVNSPHNFGLMFADALIGVMTFQKPRRAMNQKKTEGSFELVRFATSSSISGGFSKLLKFAITQLNPSEITSWADLRWTDPVKNVYLTNGFTVKSESNLGYYYTNCCERFHRFGCRKPKGEILTEQEWNLTQKRYILYDAGTINYSIKIEDLGSDVFGWAPEQASAVSNLQMLTAEDNLDKSNK